MITINGDVRIAKIVSKTRFFLQNPKKAFNQIGDMLVDEYEQNFPTEGARLGKKWKKLTAGSLAQKARLGYGGQPILVRTGKMMSNFKKEVKRLSVRVHNPTSYYQYHQLGTPNMPQRKMISAPERVKQEVVEILRKELDQNLKGRT